MNQGWRTVRVFISSTFRDMHAERDYLVKRVFPALRQRLEPHRLNLVDIDLRWGITREQADNDQVLGLCLQQIDECRPFFVGLLGGRYGWVPAKFPVEVGRRYGWTQHHTGKSVTELEILHGVLNDPAMHGRALFCFRSEDFLREIKEKEKRRVYVEGPTDEELHQLGPEEAERRAAVRRQQLADLKSRIRDPLPPMPLFDGYPCTWEAAGSSRREEALTSLPEPAVEKNEPPNVGSYSGSGRVGGLAGLGNWILDKLERAILDAPELQEHLAAVRTETRDELAEERGFHERFIESRTRVYVRRRELRDRLAEFVKGSTAQQCLVTGPSGSGKSAALARFVRIWRRARRNGNVIVHFVGASPRSTGLRDVLRHLCAELRDALKLEDEIKQDTRELCDQFREFLGKVPADRRVVLVIDALNQLDEADNAHSLYWLPGQIPPPVRLIVSCIDDPDRADQPALAAMRSRQPHEIKVGLLTDEERLGIVREIPSVAAKTLDEQQVRLLLANAATRNPLFLLVALEELRGFGSFEQLNQKISGLPQTGNTLTAIFQQVIQRLGEDFNAATVKDVLTLLACARRGLSERELLDLIEGESVRIEESAGDLFPILRQLRPYLQSRGPLLDFYHRHLGKATHEEFFKADEGVPTATHGRLADYFVGCAKGSDPAREWEAGSVRGFAECVFHLAKAGRHDHAAGLLTNFPFLLHKLRVGLLEGVSEDYDLLRREAPAEVAKRLEIWADFFREKAHILRRGNQEWPAHKILLQLAVEHADDSPLTIGAEQWLAEGRCDWLWSHRVPRLSHIRENQCLAVLEGHTEPVNSALALTDGRLLSWSWDNTLRLWDAQNGACLVVLRGHAGPVTGALAFVNGQLLSWSWDNTLRLWNRLDGSCVTAFLGHTASVNGALASADRRLLSWSNDRTLRLWESQSGTCLATLKGHNDDVWVQRCCATSDCSHGREIGLLRLWHHQSGVHLATLEGHTEAVKGALELADGQLLSWAGASWKGDSWSYDRAIRLWDGQTGVCKATLAGGDGPVENVLALENGRALSWSWDHALWLWDIQSGDCLMRLVGHSAQVNGALAMAGRRLLSWSSDMTLRLWDTLSSNCLATFVGHTNEVVGALVLSDWQMLSWSRDRTLRLWSLSGNCLATFEGHADQVLGALMLSDRRVLSWSKDKTLRLWNCHGRHRLTIIEGHAGKVSGLIALADKRLLSWSGDVESANTTLQLWDNQNGKCLRVLAGHTERVGGALELADGRLLSWSGLTLRVWDGQTGAHLATLEGHKESVRGARELTAGRLLSWSATTLRMWDSQTGACLRILEGHTDAVWGVQALADGRLLSWSGDKTLRLWDSQTGACLRILGGHTDMVWGAQALADGRLLSWSWDKTLRLWDSQRGECLASLIGHTGHVLGALILTERAPALVGRQDVAIVGWPKWSMRCNLRRAHETNMGCNGTC